MGSLRAVVVWVHSWPSWFPSHSPGSQWSHSPRLWRNLHWSTNLNYVYLCARKSEIFIDLPVCAKYNENEKISTLPCLIHFEVAVVMVVATWWFHFISKVGPAALLWKVLHSKYFRLWELLSQQHGGCDRRCISKQGAWLHVAHGP